VRRKTKPSKSNAESLYLAILGDVAQLRNKVELLTHENIGDEKLYLTDLFRDLTEMAEEVRQSRDAVRTYQVSGQALTDPNKRS